jgi:hypothetical protein
MQMQRNCWFNSLLMLEKLGSYLKIGETTKCSKPKCKIILLEEI